MGTRKQKLLKKQAIIALDALSEDRLKVAVDFLEYLKEKEEWEATAEVLADSRTMDALREADDDWNAGRMDRFVPLAEVKQRVQSHTQPSGG